MYYVVGKYRIRVESEVPVQMKDYPDCVVAEGPPGVNMINFEVYEGERGELRVRTEKLKNPLDIHFVVEGCKRLPDDSYEAKAGGEAIKVKVSLKGEPHLPPIMSIPEGV